MKKLTKLEQLINEAEAAENRAVEARKYANSKIAEAQAFASNQEMEAHVAQKNLIRYLKEMQNQEIVK